MAGKSGGTATAYGMGYQHLVVVEELLDRLENDGGAWSLFLESVDEDVVDYGFREAGRLIRAVQAKSSVDGPAGRNVSVTEAVRIFERMIRGEPADAYVLRTNRPAAPALRSLDAELALVRQWHAGSPHVAVAVRRALHQRGITLSSDIDVDPLLECFARCRVEMDDWHLREFRDELGRRIREFRRARGWGVGHESAEILVNDITMRLLQTSATAPGSALLRNQIEEMFFPAGRVVAQARGAYDWGSVTGPIPNVDAIPRPEVTDLLEEMLTGIPSRRPRKVVLTGFSGAGKSTVAAEFVRARAASYDRIIWIDAHDVSTIRQAVRPLLAARDEGDEDRTTDASGEGLEEAFLGIFPESSDTWLLVFDNARSVDEIRGWCPVQGHVDVIATSNDAASWSGWSALKVGNLPRSISISLIEKRVGIVVPTAESTESANTLARQLDDWPLTLELACAYLNATGRGLDFAPRYVDLLMSKIIDEAILVPDSYSTHSTLFRAVAVALESLASRADLSLGGTGERHLLASVALDAMAYLPGRSAHAELAVSTAMRLVGIEPKAGAAALVDDVALSLAEFSLAARGPVGRLTSSIFRINEAVLHVVRHGHSSDRRAEILATVVKTACDYVTSAIDERGRTESELIAPSATSALQWLLGSGYASTYGALLAGNLAVLWTALNHPEVSLEFYDLELSVLDVMELDAPVLRAKIHSSIAVNRTTLEQPTAAILEAANATLRELEVWPIDFDLESREKVVYQLESVLSLLKRNPREEAADIASIDDAYAALRQQIVGGGDSVYADLAKAHALLDIAGEDANALVLIDKVLADARIPDFVRLEMLGARVEALVYLRRYDDAARATDEVHTEAQRAFGIEECADKLINAWLETLYQRFAGHGAHARGLIEKMEITFSDVELSRANSQARLDACRLASAAHRGDLGGALPDVEARLEGKPFPPSRGVRSERPTQALIEASRRLIALRRQHHDAKVIAGEAWRRTSSLFGDSALWLNVDGADAQLFIRQPSTTSGEWLVEEDAILLAIHGEPTVLVDFPRRRTGWMRLEEIDADEMVLPAVVRLDEVLGSPDLVDAVRRVVVVASDIAPPLMVAAKEPSRPR